MGDSEGPPVSGGTSLLYHGLGMDWELDRLERMQGKMSLVGLIVKVARMRYDC